MAENQTTRSWELSLLTRTDSSASCESGQLFIVLNDIVCSYMSYAEFRPVNPCLATSIVHLHSTFSFRNSSCIHAIHPITWYPSACPIGLHSYDPWLTTWSGAIMTAQNTSNAVIDIHVVVLPDSTARFVHVA